MPITVAPSAFNHWQAIRPTPPAAAWNRTVSPFCTRYTRRIRYCTVRPFSIIAAACSSEMPLGTLTSLSAAYEPLFRIGAGRAACISHAVSDLDLGHTLADRFHHAGAFATDATGQRQRVQAGTMVGIDEVQADRGVPDLGLAFSRITDFDVVELQNLGSTRFMESDRLGHGSLLEVFILLIAQTASRNPRPGPLSRNGRGTVQSW